MSDAPRTRFTPRQLQIFSFAFLAFALIVLGLSIFTVGGLPSIEQLENPKPELATRVYSIDGELIDQYFIKNRTSIRFDSLPRPLVDALIVTEDRNFYSHWGISISGVLRAVAVDVFTMSKRQGASTITQQLARNLYLTQEQTIIRKIREAITALQIERTFTKKEILELYFNVSPFGRGTYGVQAAAMTYFGKPATKLTLAESALLVGLLKAPGRYDPDTHPDRARTRRNTVLAIMRNEGVISQAQCDAAQEEAVTSKSATDIYSTGMAPHFVEWLRRQLLTIPALNGHDLYREGLVVYTTLDSRMQLAADSAVTQHLRELQPEFNRRWQWSGNGRDVIAAKIIEQAARSSAPFLRCTTDVQRQRVLGSLMATRSFRDSVLNIARRIQVGFVAMDPTTGEIRAMVGASNYQEFRYGLNHVTQIQRQPGSAFKPFAYASAIQHGYPPEYRIRTADTTITMPDGQVWTPHNTEEDEIDSVMTLTAALQHSVNLAAVRVIANLTTPHDVAVLAKRMGVKSPIPEYPSIVLGSAEVNPLELTAAYCAFDNHGIGVEPYGILRVEDATGKVLYRGRTKVHDALDAPTARTMTHMMQKVVDGGTAGGIRKYFDRPAAGKTGTTQDFADAWFIGYTPELCAGMWVGFDDRRITFGGWYGQGGKAAAPMWGRFMKTVYSQKGRRFNRWSFDDDGAQGSPSVDSLHHR